MGFWLLRLELIRKAIRIMERKRTGCMGGWLWLAAVALLLVVRPVAAEESTR